MPADSHRPGGPLAGTAGASRADDGEAARLLIEERALIELVLGGHVHYFRKLVDRHQGKVIAVIYRLVGDRTESEDLAQQAFLRAFQALGDFRLELRFGAWLYRIAVNAAKDHRESKKGG